jgi:hypothetical protein
MLKLLQTTIALASLILVGCERTPKKAEALTLAQKLYPDKEIFQEFDESNSFIIRSKNGEIKRISIIIDHVEEPIIKQDYIIFKENLK